jgi:lipoprotein-anchoring transpeptidase ErfK/SrfK
MRSKSLVALLVSLVAVLVLAGGVVAYDGSRGKEIPKGVTIAGIAVGGKTPDEARAVLHRHVLDGLQRPIKVHHANKTWVLGPREAHLAVNLDALVDEAVAAGDEGNLLSRSWRRLTGGEVERSLRPRVTYSDKAVIRLIDKVRGSVERDAVNAKASMDPSGPTLVPGKTGLEVDRSRLHSEIRQAITRSTGERRFVARTHKTQPAVTTAEAQQQFDTALVVSRKSFELRVYKDFRLAKTYSIAVGMQGLETPAGLYHIQNKAVNPAWNVPNSDWAGKLAGTVVPGGDPTNPLKARWLGIFDGAGIHGIDPSEYGSIGHAASHGCVRMRIADVVDLYPRVPVGAPIYIS